MVEFPLQHASSLAEAPSLDPGNPAEVCHWDYGCSPSPDCVLVFECQQLVGPQSQSHSDGSEGIKVSWSKPSLKLHFHLARVEADEDTRQDSRLSAT
ncbi:hypothetical protein CRENBAI_019136 [Crenichthys baileyi]|uniref:Uncharacterized protein n=1 Tax=Crenichthys baileyi TaxID=28760 RepID=A0AAV9SHL6_9TELE